MTLWHVSTTLQTFQPHKWRHVLFKPRKEKPLQLIYDVTRHSVTLIYGVT